MQNLLFGAAGRLRADLIGIMREICEFYFLCYHIRFQIPDIIIIINGFVMCQETYSCLLYTSDAADEL